MGFIIQDRLEVSIFFNDVEYPLDTTNVLNFMHIVESARDTKLPLIHFSITDVKHSLDATDIPDAIPIRVVLRAYQGLTKTYSFRKFHSFREFNGQAYTYQIDGYLDSLVYWAGTAIGGMRGTSNDVLSQIATKAGLTYDGTSTNDAQLWVPRNRTYGEFAARIATRGYASDTSYMELGVNLDRVLRYKNVNTLPDPTTTIVLGQLVSGSLVATDYKPIARSGLTNKTTGYWNTRWAQSMTAESQSVAASNLAFTPDVKAPLFNNTARTQSARGNSTFSPIDVGNTHQNYERAAYQNSRYAGLYSLDVEFQLLLPSGLTLFDTFTFSVNSEVNKPDAAYAGKYTIVAKALFITGATFSEKLLGTRMGTNTSYVIG